MHSNTKRHAKDAMAKLWHRKAELEHELNETNATLIALGRMLKEPSPKKLAALKAARARIGKKPEESGS